MSTEEQRWRYQKSDKTPVWLPFRAEFPCLYCGHPVGKMSTSGPAVCGSCACGYVKPSPEEIEKRIRFEDECGFGKLLDQVEPDWREMRRRFPEHPKENNALQYMRKARQRLDALPFDPAWQEYEEAYKTRGNVA